MKNTNSTALIFGLFMVVFYFAAAFVIVFTSFFEQSFDPLVRYVLGAFFLLYGIFRAWRLIKQYSDEE
ncbi:MAG: hypothetical protein LBR52_06280 [Prevotellaceae bacterium]|jgi:hypothetical protein|nr:hypothetical protein [Prevotellaceae bacterium]